MNGLTDSTKQQTNGLSLGEFLLSLFQLDVRDKLSVGFGQSGEGANGGQAPGNVAHGFRAQR